MPPHDILVFDTGPLCNFAQQSWLGVLKAVVGHRTAMIPDVVVDELRHGTHRDSRTQAVLDAPWIEHHELQSSDEMAAFATFAERLVTGTRNIGEAGVLALAYTVGGSAVVDDGAARKAAAAGAGRPKPADRRSRNPPPQGSDDGSGERCLSAVSDLDLPHANESAARGLKFSAALPPGPAHRTVTERLGDHVGAATVLN